LFRPLIVRRVFVLHGLELLAELFLALPRCLDLGPSLGQLGLLLLCLGCRRLLPALLFLLLQLALSNLLFQRLQASISFLTLLGKVVLLNSGTIPKPLSAKA
jgi:hypothetical protein